MANAQLDLSRLVSNLIRDLGTAAVKLKLVANGAETLRNAVNCLPSDRDEAILVVQERLVRAASPHDDPDDWHEIAEHAVEALAEAGYLSLG